MNYNPLSEHEERIGKIIANSAYTVHKKLGPGLVEKVYEICLAYEISKCGLNVLRQVNVPVWYDNLKFEESLRLDLFVENKVVCEIKAIEIVNPVWQAQVLSHLKLTGVRLGFLINFNVPIIKNGIRRFVV